jgi:ribosomal protein L29
VTPLVDELHALAAMEDIDELTAEQMLLRLQERHLQRQLSDAKPDHMSELQQRLAQVRTAIREFA